jgi:hypothetical protein
MIPDAFLDELRSKLTISEVVGMYVKLDKAGCEWKALSPFRTEKTASFFVNDQKQFFYDFGSGEHGDIFEFVRKMEKLTFAEAVERCAVMAANRSGVSSPTSTPATVKPVNNRGWENIWNSAGDLFGTLVEKYLTDRKLVLAEGMSDRVLRSHPRCPWKNDAGELTHVPALIGLFRDIHTDEPKAISRRALTADGRKMGKPKSLGPVAGCAIKLTANEDVQQGLHIGEGIETMLAAMMLGFAPAWALGPGIRNFPALAGVDALTIIVDNDANRAGQGAASESFDRWTAAGREVWTVIPNAIGADMNDVVAGGR